MKIQVGRYILNTDKLNYWIEEEYEIEKGKTKGSMGIRNLTGYCWTFESALQTFRERTLGESEATTLAELLDTLQGVYDAMDALDREAFENGLKKLKEMEDDTSA